MKNRAAPSPELPGGLIRRKTACWVAAHPVQQHQRLVRRQPPQGGRADAVGAVGDGRAGEVEGGREGGERGAQFGGALALQRLLADHIDGSEGFQARAAFDARAGDDDLIDRGPWWWLSGRRRRSPAGSRPTRRRTGYVGGAFNSPEVAGRCGIGRGLGGKPGSLAFDANDKSATLPNETARQKKRRGCEPAPVVMSWSRSGF